MLTHSAAEIRKKISFYSQSFDLWNGMILISNDAKVSFRALSRNGKRAECTLITYASQEP